MWKNHPDENIQATLERKQEAEAEKADAWRDQAVDRERELFERVTTPQDNERAFLENWLLRYGQWITARELSAALPDSWCDRKLRAVASESDCIITGQSGYRHIKNSTVDEISHAANWLESQAKKMSDRACAIRRAAHGRI